MARNDVCLVRDDPRPSGPPLRGPRRHAVVLALAANDLRAPARGAHGDNGPVADRLLGLSGGVLSRDEGFAVMDVSTSLANDPKVRKLWRLAPDHAPCAFTAYVATMAESWLTGKRANIDDAWPAYMPFNKAAVEALVAVELLDADGFVPLPVWRKWFGPAKKRREQLRQRWRRYNAKRTVETTELPRGSDVSTATSDRPSVPTVRPSAPPLRPIKASRAVLELVDHMKADA